MNDSPASLWWQTGVFYNLYVRSYRDTNQDGVGDLPGVIQKLDYLQNLGIDVIWLSGILDSPWHEFGFDVRDFKAIHPALGNLEIFDDLLRQVHQRGMKLIIDYIPNHSSDEHPWFIESRSSRDNPKRDWYVWVDPRPDGAPPNNWLSTFGGSAWEWDEATGQFYLHSFLKQQPDLNWRNPEVREAMTDVLRFWLERGVDGFRCDAAHHILKDERLRDNPPNPNPRVIDGRVIQNETQLHLYDRELAEVHQVYQDLRRVIDAYSTPEQPRAWFAEVHPAGWGAWVQYYGCAQNEFNFPFNNGFIFTPWKAVDVRILIDMIESTLPQNAWPNAHTGNFDEWRMVTRVGKDQARVAAMMLMTLRGSPLLYYGEEIGMHNVDVPEEQARDLMGRQIGLSRDPQRTPMQWSPAENSGFCDPPNAECWLPVSPDYQEINVQLEWDDPKSMLSLYRALIACRRSLPALLHGAYRPVEVNNKEVFAFLRETENQRVLVALNYSDQLIDLTLPWLGRGNGDGKGSNRGHVLLSTALDRAEEPANLASLEVRPNEGIIVCVD